MQENESNESDKPTQDEQIREYGQVVLKANAGKHRIFLLSIIGEVEGHEQSPGNVKTTKYEHVLPGSTARRIRRPGERRRPTACGGTKRATTAGSSALMGAL